VATLYVHVVPSVDECRPLFLAILPCSWLCKKKLLASLVNFAHVSMLDSLRTLSNRQLLPAVPCQLFLSPEVMPG